MAIHGKNGRMYASGYDLSCYLNSIGLDKSIDTSETSVFCSDSKRYISGLKDATISAEGVYDADKDTIDNTLNELEQNVNLYSYFPAKDTAGNEGYSFLAHKTATNFAVSITDAVNFSLAGQTTEGVDRVTSIIPSTEFTTNGSSASIDLGAGTTNGAILYLHTLGVSLDATVKIEQSVDNVNWTTLHSYGTISAIGANRVFKAGVVDRYIRVTIEDLGVAESITLQASIKKL